MVEKENRNVNEGDDIYPRKLRSVIPIKYHAREFLKPVGERSFQGLVQRNLRISLLQGTVCCSWSKQISVVTPSKRSANLSEWSRMMIIREGFLILHRSDARSSMLTGAVGLPGWVSGSVRGDVNAFRCTDSASVETV